MKRFLLFTWNFLQLLLFFCLMSAGMLYFSARGDYMPRKLKPISGVCFYCGRACTFPDPGVEMVKTKRRDTFVFHRVCFMKQRKEAAKWM